MVTIKIDAGSCIGCGACVAACAKGFKMEDNKSTPINKSIDKITCENDAVDVCPVNCISVK